MSSMVRSAHIVEEIMTKRIPVSNRGKGSLAHKILKKFLKPDDMVLIEKGKELRGKKFAYHIGAYHPDIISRIHVGIIHPSMKYQIIQFIKKGQLYLRKDGIDE